MSLVKARIPATNKKAFLTIVFNAENIAHHFPEIFKQGIVLKEMSGKYYIVRNDKILTKSFYFSKSEMALFVKEVI